MKFNFLITIPVTLTLSTLSTLGTLDTYFY